MAIIQPYGDPSAHGQLNKTLVFRRRKDKVILGGINRPVKKRSLLQEQQRAKLKPANDAYGVLYYESKIFYRTRGIQLRSSANNLFIRKFLENKLPSTSYGKDIKSVLGMSIFSPAGFHSDSLEIKIEFLDQGEIDYLSYGFVEDNANIFTHEFDAVNPIRQRLKIVEGGYIGVDIPFRYVVNIHWTNFLDEEFSYWMRLPKIHLDGLEGIYLYIATDWSLYWDNTMRRLACVPNF